MTPTDYVCATYAASRALLGAIGANTQAVLLTFDGQWYFDVFLTAPTDEDREEYEDVCDTFSIGLSELRGSVSDGLHQPVDLRMHEPPLTEYDAKTQLLIFSARRGNDGATAA